MYTKKLILPIYQKYDLIVYFWALLFLIPLPISIVIGNSGVRNYDYVWVLLFLIYVFKNNILHKSRIIFSKKVIVTFFFSVLISFIYSAIAQYYSFHVPVRDFGIFDSMLQEALKRNWGFSTVTGYYHFAVHQHYILLLILPIYALVHSSICLIIINVVSLWFAGVVLWKIAKPLGHFWSFIVVLSFYLSPHLGIGSTISFYPEMFYPCVLFLIIYTYRYNCDFWLLTFIIIFLAIKEDAILYAIGVIPFLIWRKNYYKILGLVIFIILFIIVNFHFIQPYFLQKSNFQSVPTLQFWSAYGSTKADILKYILSHPFLIFANIFSYKSGFWGLYAPFLFLPLLCWPLLIVSVLPLCLFLSTNQTTTVMYKLGSYYPIVLVSLCFIGMVFFINKYKNNHVKQVVLLLILLTSSFWGDGSQGMYHINWADVKDFNQLYKHLKISYNKYNICPGSSIYPLIQINDFVKVNAYHEERDVKAFLTQSNCIMIFSSIGDNYPYAESVNYMINYAKTHKACNSIGNFYYCINQ